MSAKFWGSSCYEDTDIPFSGSCVVVGVPECNVTVPEYVVSGNSAHIVVNISGNGVTPNGTVNVTVGDVTFEDLALIDGVVELDTQVLTDNATISVSYSGCDYYDAKTFDDIAFVKVKYNPIISMVTEIPTFYEEDLTIAVSVSSMGSITPTGTVNATLSNGRTVSANLSDGEGILIFKMLDVGYYTIGDICYSGDDNFIPYNIYIGEGFTILPKSVNINANVSDYEYGSPITGSMNYTGHTGNVTLNISDVLYNGTFDSEGNFIISDILPVKEYISTFSFITNDGNYIGNALLVLMLLMLLVVLKSLLKILFMVIILLLMSLMLLVLMMSF